MVSSNTEVLSRAVSNKAALNKVEGGNLEGKVKANPHALTKNPTLKTIFPSEPPPVTEPLITLDDIARSAELAKLELSDTEKTQFVQQFEEILGYFEKMKDVPLPEDSQTPTFSTVMREDVARPSGVTPEDFSPYLENGHFKVPRVIE